jgi:hypothetical protein
MLYIGTELADEFGVDVLGRIYKLMDTAGRDVRRAIDGS